MHKFFRRLALSQFFRQIRVPRDVARYAFRRYAERIALVTPRGKLTYAQLGSRVFSFASGMEKRGVRKGDTLFCLLRDDWEQIEVRLAASEMGVLYTAFHPAHPPERILEAAALVSPAVFVFDRELGSETAIRLVSNHPNVHLIATGPDETYERIITDNKPELSKNPVSPGDPAGLGFTSGTTGKPKALFTNHGVIVTSLKMTAAQVRFSTGKAVDTILLGIPIVGAGSGALYPALITGSVLVVPESYETDEILRTIQDCGATRIFITPSQLIDILDHCNLRQYELGTLRNVIYGTAPMPAAKLEEAIVRFGPIFQQGYGLAEVLPPVSMLQMHEHVIAGKPASRAVLNSVGRVVSGVSVKIVDEEGKKKSDGEIGEILIKSPTTFSGYWQQPDLTARILKDGWMHTSDFGFRDREGWLHVLDRSVDLLYRAGRTIYPRLIEETVHDHPAVKEACLVCEEETGAHVLCLSLRKGYRQQTNPEELSTVILDFLSDYHDSLELPDRVEIFEELPRSYLRKVLRREVREALRSE